MEGPVATVVRDISVSALQDGQDTCVNRVGPLYHKVDEVSLWMEQTDSMLLLFFVHNFICILTVVEHVVIFLYTASCILIVLVLVKQMLMSAHQILVLMLSNVLTWWMTMPASVKPDGKEATVMRVSIFIPFFLGVLCVLCTVKSWHHITIHCTWTLSLKFILLHFEHFFLRVFFLCGNALQFIYFDFCRYQWLCWSMSQWWNLCWLTEWLQMQLPWWIYRQELWDQHWWMPKQPLLKWRSV